MVIRFFSKIDGTNALHVPVGYVRAVWCNSDRQILHPCEHLMCPLLPRHGFAHLHRRGYSRRQLTGEL